MSAEIQLLTQIRDLLQIMAEPQIAARDKRLREALTQTVGRSLKGQKAVVLMDGSRKQKEIAKEAGIDQGQLSTLVKTLGEKKLMEAVDGKPRLVIPIPKSFFENGEQE